MRNLIIILLCAVSCMASAVGIRGAAYYATPWYLSGGVASSNCIAAWQPKGASSLSNGYVNLVTPGTLNLYEGVAPTWNSATGFVFNGSSQYLKTGITPSINTTIIVKFNGGSATGTRAVYGYGDNINPAFRAFSVLGSASPYIGVFNSVFNAGSAMTSGTIAGNRYGAYTNGILAATFNAAVVGSPLELNLGCQNVLGSPNSYFIGGVQAAAVYNTPLTSNQVAAITAAMNGL